MKRHYTIDDERDYDATIAFLRAQSAQAIELIQLREENARLQQERDAALAVAADSARVCARLRAALEWYADEQHWIESVMLMGETEEAGEITGQVAGRGKMPGEFGLMPGCRCGQCLDYWHADDGARARAALKEQTDG